MFDLIKNFPAQLIEAIKIGEAVNLNTAFKDGIKNIVVSGLGGSGIGGNLVAELYRKELDVPVIVNKGYQLPGFINSSTLLILCSYSGNTEETITCANEAIKKGLRPILISSGGRLEEIAGTHQLDLIKIPPGFPPRTCLGYSVTQLLYVLKFYKLINSSFVDSLKQTSAFLSSGQNEIQNHTKALAKEIAGKVVIVYAEEKYDSVALRIKQQINENSKMQCWFNVVPELNHNELVGWRQPNDNLALIILRAADEYPRNTRRIEFTKTVAAKIQKKIYEISAKGNSAFEQHFYLVHWGDWLSYYLAIEQGYDPMEIDVLNKLKGELSAAKEA